MTMGELVAAVAAAVRALGPMPTTLDATAAAEGVYVGPGPWRMTPAARQHWEHARSVRLLAVSRADALAVLEAAAVALAASVPAGMTLRTYEMVEAESPDVLRSQGLRLAYATATYHSIEKEPAYG